MKPLTIQGIMDKSMYNHKSQAFEYGQPPTLRNRSLSLKRRSSRGVSGGMLRLSEPEMPRLENLMGKNMKNDMDTDFII